MKQLIEYIKSHKKYKTTEVNSKYLTQEVKDVLSKYNLTLYELCYRIKNGILLDKVFTCKCCGKKIVLKGSHGYPEYCSYKCVATYNQPHSDVRNKYKQTMLNKYGVNHYSKTQDFKDKRAQTCLEKYGVENYTQTQEYKDKMKQYCLENFGVDSYSKTQEFKEKVKQICLDKFGTDNYFKSQDYKDHQDEIRDKAKQTCIKKYGVDSYSKTKDFKYRISDRSKVIYEKRKQTCRIKYDADNPAKVEKFKDKVKQTCLDKYGVSSYVRTQDYKDFIREQHDVIQDKSKQTCINKYGVPYYTKSQEFKDRYDEIQEKSYNTKKKNNSFIKSIEEEKVYQLLLTKFTKEDIIRQYKSELYPFNCDFYIKSLDLYIEYNGTWTHGKDVSGKIYGSFDKDNPEHIKLLEFWESKNTKFYKTAIYVWTDLDVRKLETFKKNKLNYKIFWTVREVEDWLKEI